MASLTKQRYRSIKAYMGRYDSFARKIRMPMNAISIIYHAVDFSDPKLCTLLQSSNQRRMHYA